jgi:voltage-gated potassium channel Kch
MIVANAAEPGVLRAANLAGARWFISAIPSPFENGNLVEQARAANPNLEIIARAHSDAEVDHLEEYGASFIIMGEREIARGMTEHIFERIEGDSLTAAGDPKNATADALANIRPINLQRNAVTPTRVGSSSVRPEAPYRSASLSQLRVRARGDALVGAGMP